MIVVDASVALELVLATPLAGSVRARLFRPQETLHAPHLLDVEVANALRRGVAAGRVSSRRGKEALDLLGELPLHRYPHELLLPRIWELRQNATAYDAAYLALAEGLSAPLLTLDARLAAAPGHRAKVELLPAALA
ncbi:MAG: type II toxin-antitoxin system VapC family toxin [Thermoanaerobaculia bacterium]